MEAMSQSLATYPLLQCIVCAAQFAGGEISFYDTYAELMAADAEGSHTSPLRIYYDLTEHFRIVNAQQLLRLTLPRSAVQSWAAHNDFASQLDDNDSAEGAPHHRGAAPPVRSAVLLLQLGVDDMARFLQAIAPVVAASRRTRSVSRISVTEPLPLYATVADPAPDVATDSRASSCATTVVLSGSPACLTDGLGDSRTERQKADTTATPALLGDDAGSMDGDADREALTWQRGRSQRTSETQRLEATRTPELEIKVAAKPAPRLVLPETLESVESALADLLEDTDYPGMHAAGDGGRDARAAQPLKRPIPGLPGFLPASNVVAGRGRGRGRGRGCDGWQVSGKGAARGAEGVNDAASVCPSLPSSAAPESLKAVMQKNEKEKAETNCHGMPAPHRTDAAKGKGGQQTNRLVITHLCASDRGSCVAASDHHECHADPAADTTAETVATVTLQEHRFPKPASNDGIFAEKLEELRAPTLQQQQQQQLRAFASENQKQSIQKTVREEKQKHLTVPELPSPASSSALLGDFLTKPSTVELAVSAARLPSNASAVPGAKVKETRDIAAPLIAAKSTDSPAKVRACHPGNEASTLQPPRHPLSNGQLQREVSSYLLDLFPLAGPPAKAPRKTNAKKDSQQAPAAPRRRGRPPKTQRTTIAPSKRAEQAAATTTGTAATTNEKSMAQHRPLRTSSRSGTRPGAKRGRSGDADGSAQRGASVDDNAIVPPCKQRRVGVHHKAAPSSLKNRERRSSSLLRDARLLGMVEAPQDVGNTSSPAVGGGGPLPNRRSPAKSSSGDGGRGAATLSVEADAADSTPVPPLPSPTKRPPQPTETSAVNAKPRVLEMAQPLTLSEQPRDNTVCCHQQKPRNPLPSKNRVGVVNVNEDNDSCSSKATCPLFYSHDSRKERMRRALRYMNVISQNLAVVHETQDELRGLLLAMLSDGQL